MNKKNLIIIGIAVVLAAGAWAASSLVLTPALAPAPMVSDDENLESSLPEESPVENNGTATTTEDAATSTTPVAPAKKPARIAIDKTLFNYDIVRGTTPCGDTIGTVHVTSDDPSKELYWGMTGSMPIWLTFSQVEGVTPGAIDMIFNCVLSGAEDDINWEFTLVEKTKEGKYVDGYYRAFKLIGDIQ